MKWGDKSDFSKMAFREVVQPEKMVWHHSSTDAEWNIVSSPMMANWPRVLLTTVTFQETDGKTTVRLSQIPLDATDAEIACFAEMMVNMDKGWGSGFKMLDGLLQDLRAA